MEDHNMAGRGFITTSLKGWTLNVSIDLKKFVGRLLKGAPEEKVKKVVKVVRKAKVKKDAPTHTGPTGSPPNMMH